MGIIKKPYKFGPKLVNFTKPCKFKLAGFRNPASLNLSTLNLQGFRNPASLSQNLCGFETLQVFKTSQVWAQTCRVLKACKFKLAGFRKVQKFGPKLGGFLKNSQIIPKFCAFFILEQKLVADLSCQLSINPSSRIYVENYIENRVDFM